MAKEARVWPELIYVASNDSSPTICDLCASYAPVRHRLLIW